MLTKYWKILLLILFVIGFVVYVVFRESYIAELELSSGAYESQVKQLKTERDKSIETAAALRDTISKRDKKITTMQSELDILPTDAEVLQDNPIIVLTTNNEWDEILRANEMADDTTFFQP